MGDSKEFFDMDRIRYLKAELRRYDSMDLSTARVVCIFVPIFVRSAIEHLNIGCNQDGVYKWITGYGAHGP